MENIFIKLVITSMFTILSTDICAANSNMHKLQESTYILKITSPESNRAVQFDGSYITMNNRNSKIIYVKQRTPFSAIVKTKFLGAMIRTNEENSLIKVEILEKKKNNIEHQLVSGIGHAVVATGSDIDKGSFILSR